MFARLEQFAGLGLILVVLADVFLNVLYARAGIAIISRPLAHGVRALFIGVGRLSGRHRPRLLSFCGPAIVVALVVAWVAMLTIGAALVLQPALGTSLRADGESTGRGFTTAIYVAAGAISSAGSGAITPHTPAYDLFLAFSCFLGISVMTLTITYLMQLYTALQARDELALKVELMTGQTGDAARLVTGLGPDGRFEIGYTVLAEMAGELSRVKEAHHLYPVLFYFRFPQAYYELSRFTLVLLDAVALIRAGLDERACGWLKRSAALEHLERGGLVLIETLHRVYLRDEGEGPEEPTPEEIAAWRRRFARALVLLREAGVPVTRDLDRASDAYVRLRNQWNDALIRLGGAIGHEPQEIDAALHAPTPPRPRPEPVAPVVH